MHGARCADGCIPAFFSIDRLDALEFAACSVDRKSVVIGAESPFRKAFCGNADAAHIEAVHHGGLESFAKYELS